MYDKRRLAVGLFDNTVLNTLAYFSRRRENFYNPFFIARRLRRRGIDATVEKVENSLNLLEYYHFVERCEDSECYRTSLEGKLNLRGN